VPRADARGRITSHRARSTIASQLYNAKEPMTLFELQAWLGHRSPQSTQHYTQITPTRLAQAYADAGYFARNLRTVEVLIDREAVQTGAAATGTPWQYFDLGHGYCTYNFFEQCPHRMACARCDFYLPKVSTHAQLLEARGHLQRMLTAIPLTEGERAAGRGRRRGGQATARSPRGHADTGRADPSRNLGNPATSADPHPTSPITRSLTRDSTESRRIVPWTTGESSSATPLP
jgi:Phage integrase family